MLNVVFASSNTYAPLLMISLISLLENNKKDFKNINVFILDDEISDENKNNILKKTNNYNCNVSFIKTKDLNSMDFHVKSFEKRTTGSSLTTYARLFVSTLLPPNIDKVIYLDCDSLIVGSFKKLWEMDLTNEYCAGVLISLSEPVLKCFGFDENDNYINAGFLLINLKKWRDEKIELEFLNYLKENQGKFYCHDQGVLNDVFRNNIKIIEPKYNLQLYFQSHSYNLARKYQGIKGDYYSKEIIEDSRNNPVFVHFCGNESERPWYNKDHIYAKEFIKYAKIANQLDVIDYMDFPSLKVKLFYKAANNRFLSALLNLIPFKIIASSVNNNMINAFKKEQNKAQELLKK